MMNVTKHITIPPFYGVTDALGPTIRLFCENFWLISKIVVVIVVPFEIFKALSMAKLERDWEMAGAIFLLDQACKVLIAPALIYALTLVIETGKAPGVNESFRWGAGKLGKIAICALWVGLLQALGYALCIVPGIFVTLTFVLVYPIAVLETGSASDALVESHERTKGHLWKIFAALIVIWLLVHTFSLPVTYAAADLAANDPAFKPLSVIAEILSSIVEQATTVLSLVFYLSIRALWEEAHSN